MDDKTNVKGHECLHACAHIGDFQCRFPVHWHQHIATRCRVFRALSDDDWGKKNNERWVMVFDVAKIDEKTVFISCSGDLSGRIHPVPRFRCRQHFRFFLKLR